MTEGVHTAALAAAVAVGDRYGLPTGAPEVLNDGSNLLVRLGPMVARVATTTALIRPGVEAWLARDVALARFAAERGAPVISPCDDPPAGPHIAGGLAITLWPFTRHDRGDVAPPGEVGRLLGELHQVLRDFPGEMPAGGTASDVPRMLDLLDTSNAATSAELARLREHATEVISRAAAASADWPSQVLHGDPHPANLILTSAGQRWIDFEDAYFGPLGWDLAVLRQTSMLDGRAALAAYPGAPTGDLEPFLALRKLQGVCWRLILATRQPEHRQPARARLVSYLRG